MSRASETGAGDTSPDSQRVSSRRDSCIWIVDDSPAQLEACRAALAAEFEVSTFSGGGVVLEALAAARAPDVIVLDWHMPDVSGLEVCRFVRGQFALGELPMLILTASASRDAVLEALDAGANDFVTKPVADLEIRARVAGLARMAATHAALLETQRELKVEAEFRERFIGILAHDLRQPLNTMILANQTMGLAAGSSEAPPAALAVQMRAATRMKRMIGDLLDFSRSRPETGMPVQRQVADLAEIARTIVDEMRPAWPRHALTMQADGPCTGNWDPERLAQICSNLIGNALEHSAADSPIDVSVTVTPQGAELTVSNQGAAIPAGVLATLFEPFRRGGGLKSTSKGVGLGLYIVAEIVRAHGGTIAAESNAVTTRFSVRLPFAA